jgi:hypothetical protein
MLLQYWPPANDFVVLAPNLFGRFFTTIFGAVEVSSRPHWESNQETGNPAAAAYLGSSQVPQS